jgi:hypothetical protein
MWLCICAFIAYVTYLYILFIVTTISSYLPVCLSVGWVIFSNFLLIPDLNFILNLIQNVSFLFQQHGLTPLHVAVHYGHEDVAMELMDNKASPYAKAKVFSIMKTHVHKTILKENTCNILLTWTLNVNPSL